MKHSPCLKRILILLIAALFYSITQAQVCGGTSLTSQSEVDAFNCSSITGTFTIAGDDITDLSPLSTLTSVEGIIQIINNQNLTNVDGLSSLSYASSNIYIKNNSQLENLDGLSSLTTMGSYLEISNNPLLSNVDGLANLGSVSEINITDNNSLVSISGFLSLTSVNSIDIENNDALLNTGGFSNITDIVTLVINGNDALLNLNGFSSLTSLGKIEIDNNDALSNIDGFASLSSVQTVNILNNNSLANVNCLSGINSANRVEISNNPSLINIDGLSTVTIMPNTINISSNISLTNVDGLSGITKIGHLYIEENEALSNMNGLSNLTQISKLIIGGSNVLSNVDSLSNITSIDELNIYDNINLLNVDGLSGFDRVDILSIYGNTSLLNLSGFSNLKYIPWSLFLSDNSSLTDLDGLSSLTAAHWIEISDNTSLENIDGLSGIASINRLVIEGNTALNNINGLSNFAIVGDITIEGNNGLLNVDALSNIWSINNLYIYQNNNLLNVDGLSGISSILKLEIDRNDALLNVNGLSNLNTVYSIAISGNSSLLDVDGLSNLSSINSLEISENNNLENVDGLSGINSISSIEIWGNGMLLDVHGLSNIITIGDISIWNNALTNLDGFSSLTSVSGDLFIVDNLDLFRLCGLYTLLNGNGLSGSYDVYGNDQNPTQQEITDEGICTPYCYDFTINLKDSNGNALSGGVLEYKEDGNWFIADEISDGLFCIDTDKENINLRMTYTEAPLYVTVPTSSPYAIQTILTTFELRKRTGLLGYNFGAISYASGDTLGLTGDDGLGLFKMELLPREYTFRMKFRGGFGDITQDITADPIVTWLMARMLVQINKSDGDRGLNGATIHYKGTSKVQFGVTGTVENGRARKDLLQGFYKFTFKYLGGSLVVDNFEIVPGDNELIIDGIATTVELLDSDNSDAQLDGGIVKNIGNTSNPMGTTGDGGPGIVTVDLLPLVYTFTMQYGTDKETKNGVDITTTPWITFYTDDLKTSTIGNNRDIGLVAYPNPFSRNTTIALSLEQAEEVSVAIYDISGRMVEVLFEGYMEGGNHKLDWDGAEVLGGFYIVRFTSNGNVYHRNVVKM